MNNVDKILRFYLNQNMSLNNFIALNLNNPNLTPIEEKLHKYSEQELFTVMEIIHDVVSENDHARGWYAFVQQGAQEFYRAQINSIIKNYGDGYEMQRNGRIYKLPPKELQELHDEKIESGNPRNIDFLVMETKNDYFRSNASLENKRDSIKKLYDVLEYLREEAKNYLLSNDENDLFNIANNFYFRHHNLEQKKDYDFNIYYDWIFYNCLNTINLLVKIISQRGSP